MRQLVEQRRAVEFNQKVDFLLLRLQLLELVFLSRMNEVDLVVRSMSVLLSVKSVQLPTDLVAAALVDTSPTYNLCLPLSTCRFVSRT